MVFQECFYSFFLLVCKITAFNVYEIIQNTESNSTSEGQGETMQNNCEGQTVSLAIQHVFWEVVLLFFFLLVCEILSPVCPPKKLFKNLHIDIQHFIQQKYHLRGEINILHRKISMDIHSVISSRTSSAVMIITRNPESDNTFYSVQFRDMELKILGIANAEKVLDAVKDYVENGGVVSR